MADGKGILGRSGASKPADGDDTSSEHASQPLHSENNQDAEGSSATITFPGSSSTEDGEGLPDHQAEAVEADRRSGEPGDEPDAGNGGIGPYDPSDLESDAYPISGDASVDVMNIVIQLQTDMMSLTAAVSSLTGIVKATDTGVASSTEPPPENKLIATDCGYTIVWDDAYLPAKPYKVLDENGRAGAIAATEKTARQLLQRLIDVRRRNNPDWTG